MPYANIDELPDSVKVLPTEAQQQFLKVVNSALEQYEGDEGKAFAVAWASIKQKWTKKDDQWIKKEGASESFSWAGSIKEMPGVSNLIRGKALHPIRTVHPDEWPEVRVYLEEELQKSAHTLAGKPLLLDHMQSLRGEVVGAEYEDGAIEYVAKLEDPQIWSLIQNGDIKHCSVEFEWDYLKNVNGVAPLGINFTGLSLLKDFLPGDPLSSVDCWEAIVKRLKEAKNVRRRGNPGSSTAKEQAEQQEFILYMLHDPMAFLPEHFSTAWIDQTNGIQGIFGRLREDPENSVPQALLFMKVNNWTLEKMQDWLQNHPQYLRGPAPAHPGIQPASGETGVMKMSEQNQEQAPPEEIPTPPPEPTLEEIVKSLQQAVEQINENFASLDARLKALEGGGTAQEAEWDTEYINDLPDSAFAVIAAGGEKDDQGKTVPRTLRKLPHHNMQGNLDLPHLRNALARVNQIEGGDKAKAKKHLCGHARGEKAEDLISRFCGEEPETAGEQQGDQEPEKDEHGCLIGKERYDEEQDKCVPITAEARIAFLEASLKLKEQELTEEEIKQKIADLTAQRDALYKQVEEIAEEERAEIQKQIDVLHAEIEAYEQALATKIAGQAAPPEQAPATEKKKGLGEAIITPSEPQPSDLISKEKIRAVLPPWVAVKSSFGLKRLVEDIQRVLRES